MPKKTLGFCVALVLLTPAVAAESLMEIVNGQNTTITDNVVQQIAADTRDNMNWKLQIWYNNDKHLPDNGRSFELFWVFTDNNTGFISRTFTTPADLEDLEYFRFGLDGAKLDTLVVFNIKDIQPNTTYTLQWRVLNTTQGERSWTDMFLTRCGDGYALPLGETNCSRACPNQAMDGGYIPPEAARVYEPAICQYNPDNLICHSGWLKTSRGVCAELCTTGISHIRAGAVTAPLFTTRHTSPSLVVLTTGGICYGNLMPGTGPGINVTVGDTTYHME